MVPDAPSPTPPALAPMFEQPAAVDPLLGQSVSRYRIIKVIGSGGMGVVYLGEHETIGSRVAIKFLHPWLVGNPEAVARFHAEARAVNLFGHPNIVSVFDMGTLADGRAYLVMEYLEGTCLAELAAHAPIPFARTLRILEQMADALDIAHQAGVVHRDLKPENVMLLSRGREHDFVKVLDFGIAKLQSQRGDRQTTTGVVVGTPEYMAPEQAQGVAIDGQADQYALGVMAFELLTGQTPFAGLTVPAMLVAHLSQPPRAPHELNPALDPAASTAVLKALSKTPTTRFRSCVAFVDALRAGIDGVPVSSDSRVPGATGSGVRPATSPPAAQPAVAQPVPVSRISSTRATPGPLPPIGAQRRYTLTIEAENSAAYRAQAQDLTVNGCVVASRLPPRLFTPVVLVFPSLGRVQGEVVRVIGAKDAAAWKLPEGFVVQFKPLGADQRRALEQLIHGLEPAPQPEAHPDDPLAEKLLLDVRKRVMSEHYALLGLPADADTATIRARAKELASQLEQLGRRPVSPRQRRELEEAQSKLQRTLTVLVNPLSRAAYDGDRLNWRGVAVAIAAGLRVGELEALRNAFLRKNPQVVSHITVLERQVAGHDRARQYAEALALTERGLAMDPLNLTLQNRRRELERQVAAEGSGVRRPKR